jgi:hypothetical protein
VDFTQLNKINKEKRMKKISIFFAALATFCFLTVGSVSAQGNDPECGIFLLGPGTTFITLDTGFDQIASLCQSASDTCSGPTNTMGYSLVTCESSCQQVTTLQLTTMSRNIKYGGPFDSIIQLDRYKTIDPTGFGTFIFDDPRTGNSWTGTVIKSESSSTRIHSLFTGSMPSGRCDTSYSISKSTTQPDGAEYMNKVWAELDGTSEYTVAIFTYSGITDSASLPTYLYNATGGWYFGNAIATPIAIATVEITKPIIGDLDGNGVVNFSDFSIFGSNWAAVTLCGCGSYWY